MLPQPSATLCCLRGLVLRCILHSVLHRVGRVLGLSLAVVAPSSNWRWAMFVYTFSVLLSRSVFEECGLKEWLRHVSEPRRPRSG